MCGIVGMIGPINQQEAELFKDFLDVCQVRGRDATGVFIVNKDGDYDHVKRVGTPSILYEHVTYQEIVEKANNLAIIGHCRKKTIGDNVSKNAHPFDTTNVLGIHNGTLRGYHSWPEHKFSMVDSQSLFERLSNIGAKDLFETVDGAYACIWYDKNDKTINIIRNSERPLYGTLTEGTRPILLVASEPWMFGVIQRVRPLWDGSEAVPKIFQFEEMTHYVFKYNEESKTMEIFPTTKKYTKKENVVPFANRGTGNKEYWQNRGGSFYRQKFFELDDNDDGDVQDPFVREKKEDPPPLLLLPTPERNNISNSEKGSSNISLTQEETRKMLEDTIFKGSRSRIQESSSDISQQTNKKEFSKISRDSLELSNKKQALPKFGVSHRKIAGMDYITCKATSIEYKADLFMAKAKNTCSWCNKKIDSHFLVGQIINDKTFLCVNCCKETMNYKAIVNRI